MKKKSAIGQLPKRFQEVSRGFAASRMGTVGSTEHWVTVPKGLHMIPKCIKSSSNPIKNQSHKSENILLIVKEVLDSQILALFDS